jgi:hypothetical protein
MSALPPGIATIEGVADANFAIFTANCLTSAREYLGADALNSVRNTLGDLANTAGLEDAKLERTVSLGEEVKNALSNCGVSFDGEVNHVEMASAPDVPLGPDKVNELIGETGPGGGRGV